MALRLEGNDGEMGAKVAQLRNRLPVNPAFPIPARVADSRAMSVSRTIPPFHIGLDCFGARPDQPVTHPSTKAAPIAEQVKRLEYAGLPGSVVTQQQVDADTRRQPGAFDGTDVLKLQSGDLHLRLHRMRNRPDRPGGDVSRGTLSDALSEAQRHHHMATAFIAGLLHQGGGVGIAHRQYDLFVAQGGKRVEQIGDIEADLQAVDLGLCI